MPLSFIAACLLSAHGLNALLITEIVDGPLPGGQPKWIELANVSGSTLDLAQFSVGVMHNGSLSLSGPPHRLSGELSSGERMVVAMGNISPTSGPVFYSTYGLQPDDTMSALINGDDVILLYMDASSGSDQGAELIDSFGWAGYDGTGSVWEYTDSYARRCLEQSNGGPFDPSQWHLPGPGALEEGCGGDPLCEKALLIAVTSPWSQAECSVQPVGSPYCPGSGGACPCGNDNDGSDPNSGCSNSSHAAGARLRTFGAASASAPSLSLTCDNIPPNSTVIFFEGRQAVASGSGAPFGSGLRCAGGITHRLATPIQENGGSTSLAIDAGDLTPRSPGTETYFQAWYEDRARFESCGGMFNLSNAMRVVWAP